MLETARAPTHVLGRECSWSESIVRGSRRPMQQDAGGPLPVLVWFYGGGWNHGGTASPLFDGSYQVAKTVADGNPVILANAVAHTHTHTHAHLSLHLASTLSVSGSLTLCLCLRLSLCLSFSYTVVYRISLSTNKEVVDSGLTVPGCAVGPLDHSQLSARGVRLPGAWSGIQFGTPAVVATR